MNWIAKAAQELASHFSFGSGRDSYVTDEQDGTMKKDLLDTYTEQLLRELPDEKLRLAVLSAAELFSTLKAEAIRRGIWDDLKSKKVP